MEKQLTLRKAEVEDAEAIYSWRNSPQTKKYFFDQKDISWMEHKQWFFDVLQRKDRFILIGEMIKMPVGVLRYDLDGDCAEVSIYLVPGLQGNGIGTKLLCAGNKWLRANLPNVKRIIAKIRHENISSNKAFKKAGFQNFYNVYEFCWLKET